MKTFTLVLLVGVVLGAVYMTSAQDDDSSSLDELDKMMGEAADEVDSAQAVAPAGDDGKKGGKKGGRGGGRMKGLLKKFCAKMESKKEKMAKLKGKGGGMMDKFMSKCDQVKQGKDTEENDADFMKENFMKGWGKGGKGGKKGKGSDMHEKLKGKLQGWMSKMKGGKSE